MDFTSAKYEKESTGSAFFADTPTDRWILYTDRDD